MKKRLTSKLKEQIKQNYKKLKKSDFSGKALTYLNRVKGAAKAREAKKKQYIQVGDEQVKRTSELGKVLENSAKAKGKTVKQFVKENLSDVQKLKTDYKETDNKAIDDISKVIENRPSNAKVFVNGERFSEVEAVFQLEHFRNQIRRIDKSIMQILVDFQLDLKGNIYLQLPEMPDDIEEMELEDLANYFEDYGITIIISERTKEKEKEKAPPRNRLYKKRKKSKSKSKKKKK